MLLVALSRRMCCSRVCSAMRNAGLPAASRDTPMMRPGMVRSRSSRAAMNAACGPPKPSGTPKRCAEPIAMSAPIAPGDFDSISASGSQPTVTRPPAARSAAIGAAKSRRRPKVSGVCRCAPKNPAAPAPASARSASSTASSMPIHLARVLTTASTCGCVAASTR